MSKIDAGILACGLRISDLKRASNAPLGAPYKSAEDWLHNLSSTTNTQVDAEKCLQEIERIDREINTLQLRRTQAVQRAQEICPHPIGDLIHGGFATSSGLHFSELATCSKCGRAWSRDTTPVPKNFYVD